MGVCIPRSSLYKTPIIILPSPRLFLFWGLLRTGISLECEFCSEVGLHCSGTTLTCVPGQNTCLTVLFESTLGDTMVQSIKKSCAFSNDCRSPTEYLNVGHGKLLRTNVFCCTGKACKKAPPQLPPLKTVINGKQCPACYSQTGACNPELMNCTGSEHYCFDMFTQTYSEDGTRTSLLMGCTIKPGCDSINYGSTPYLEGTDTVVTKSRCLTSKFSRSSAPSRFCLPDFTGLLLLLIFL